MKMFELRCEMNLIKANFPNMGSLTQEICVNECKSKINNNHLARCPKINSESEQKYNYTHLLNGTLPEKIETYKQKLRDLHATKKRNKCKVK